MRFFPGFHEFNYPVTDILTMPKSWRQAIDRLKGVYLLTCSKTGKQYVGAAYGEDGFIQRWTNYAEAGDGNNKGIIDHITTHGHHFVVSLLEITASTDLPEDILRKESAWKAKLKTKEFGLNGN